MTEREIIYKTFPKLFNYPDDELIEWIRSGVLSNFLNLINMEDAKIQELNKWSKLNSKKELLEVLQVEYNHLFISSFPNIPAPLYKSFYEKGLLGCNPEQLIDTYIKYGFEDAILSSELPDNLSLQFEFVSLLIKNNVPLNEQQNFISEFIISWTKKLENKITKNARLEFYKKIILSTNNFLLDDLASDVKIN